MFLQREPHKLLNTQTNTTTSSWETTGFFPFNPHPEAWKNVLSTLGHLNSEIKKTQTGETEEEKEYEIQVKEGVKETAFINEEKEVLLEGNLDFNVGEFTAVDVCAPNGYLTFYFKCLFFFGS